MLFSMCTLSSIAQNKKRDRVKSLKISFITNAIELTPKEAEKFWPVYNQYSKQTVALRNKIDNGFKSIELQGGPDKLTSAEAAEFVSKITLLEVDIAELNSDRNETLLSIISAKKIIKLLEAERGFNKRMLQEFGKRKRINNN